MARRKTKDDRGEMIQKTLDMLILRPVLAVHAIEWTSEDILQVDLNTLAARRDLRES